MNFPLSLRRVQAKELFPLILTSLAMAYGWRYRGTVGHEGGAMVSGAMLGLAVCLASRRPDWQRRSLVAALVGSIGWAWGGALSYMEQTSYIISGSFLDVLYGCSALFLIGAIWAGIGGAILGLAFTEPRSRIERFMGPFVAVCTAFLATHLYLVFHPDTLNLYERFTAEHFHDSEWLPATTIILVTGLYALIRPRERSEALLFVAAAAAWWIGYLLLTKFGGLRLGPPYRSEAWGGTLAVLIMVVAHLYWQRNKAALLLSFYGAIIGGLGFALAYGVFREYAEETVGLFMGLGIALGVRRLERTGLAPALEDVPAIRLDLFAAFTVLIALMWVNLRRAPMAWIDRFGFLPNEPILGFMPWVWYAAGGGLASATVVYALAQYARGRLPIVVAGAYSKAAIVLLYLIWVTFAGAVLHFFPEAAAGQFPLSHATLFVLAVVVTSMLLVTRTPINEGVVCPSGIVPSDGRWNLRNAFVVSVLACPLVLLATTGYCMAKHDGTSDRARLRFGPEAYWRKISQVEGIWNYAGIAPTIGSVPVPTSGAAPEQLEFRKDRSVVAQIGSEVKSNAHSWQHRNSAVWLDWNSRAPDNDPKAALKLAIDAGRLYVPWPPGKEDGYAVYAKAPF
ncbi:MAG: hypothetical protein AMXMBFR84_17430 [Candidatus Hydrogenedentota bacterium]